MNNKKVAEWILELADWFEGIAQSSTMTCTNELNMKRAQMWRNRADQVEAMTCDGCTKYNEHYEQVTNYNHRVNMCLDGYVSNQGPKFGCIHWEEKK